MGRPSLSCATQVPPRSPSLADGSRRGDRPMVAEALQARMKPLVPVRRAAAFRPHFFKDAFTRAVTAEPLFWPLQRAAKALAGYDDFPPVDALASVFRGEAPVRFVPA